MRILVMLMGLSLVACESDPKPTPSPDTATPVTTASPTTQPTATATARPAAVDSSAPAPTASPTATATAAAEAPATLLERLTSSDRIRLRRPMGGGSEVVIDNPEEVRLWRKTIDLEQEPADVCPRCMPTVQIVFEDAARTRLGSIGLFCDGGDGAEVAVLRDALAESCQTLKLAEPETLQKMVDKELGPAKAP